MESITTEFLTSSHIPLRANTNGKCQLSNYQSKELKASRLLSIDFPNQKEREMGIDSVFVREFISSKKIAKIFVSKTNKDYFSQSTTKNTFRKDLLLEENIEDASLWAHPIVLGGKSFQLKTGMGTEEISDLIEQAYITGKKEAEKIELKEIEESIKEDRISCSRMAMSLEEYYNAYHPEKLEWLEKEKQFRAKIISNNKEDKSKTATTKNKQSLSQLRSDAGLTG